MRVRVVGAGVLGLTSALRLAEAGHQVEVVAAGFGEATTSSVAAALWYPYRATPDAQVLGWLTTSYAALARWRPIRPPGCGCGRAGSCSASRSPTRGGARRLPA